MPTIQKYTKPGLRESIKKRITAGSKGGKPVSGSARSANRWLLNTKKGGTARWPV